MSGTAASLSQRPDLNWLRACAVAEVVITHSDLAIKHFSQNILRSGSYIPFSGVGVEIFFLLSGYLICLNAPTYQNALEFLRSRALRIFPMYIIFTFITLAARLINPSWTWNGYDMSVSTLLRSFLILPQSWFPIVGVGWSLEHEVIFYELTALMMAGIGLASGKRIWFGFGLVILGWIGLGLGFQPIDGTWYHHLFSVLMIAFGLGWLYCCYEQFRDGVVLKIIAVCAIGTTLLLWVADPMNTEKVLRIAGSAAFCLIVVRQRGRIRPGGRADRIIAPIGAAAYSIYLSHWFVLSGFGKLLGYLQMPAETALALRVCVIVVSLGVGLLVYAALERPLDRWLRAGQTFREAFTVLRMKPDLPGRTVPKAVIPS